MNKQKLIIIVAAFALVGIIAASIYFLSSKSMTTTEITGTQTTAEVTPKEENDANIPSVKSAPELNEAILQQKPELSANGQPIFDVIDTKQVDDIWYIVKVRNTVDASIGTAWIILKDQGQTDGGLVVVAGPGTRFPSSVPIPDDVRKQIK